MLKLDETLFIGKGHDKLCYRHPENESLCVKIPVSSHGQAGMRADLKYRERLRKLKMDLPFVARYFGTAETSLGLGYVYEMVRDTDGKISKTLGYYMRDEKLLPADMGHILKAMGAFKDFVFKNEVKANDIVTPNLLIQKTKDGYVAKYADDLGSRVFIPLEYYISCFARRRLRDRWDRLIRKTKHSCTGSLAERFIEELG